MPISEVATKAKAHGYEWVALLLDDDGSSQDAKDTGAYNRSIWPQYCAEFRNRGMLAGCWFTQGGNLHAAPGDSDLAIAEIEGPGDYTGVLNVINGVGAGPLPRCSLAIVTNFNSPLISRAAARPLIDAQFTCLTESYMNVNPNLTPDHMDQIARNLGWGTSQPVAGVYPVGGHPIPSYAQWADWPLADYLLEYVI